LPGREPSCELLRLSDVLSWLRISRDTVEMLEKRKRITPFRKCKGARAWYRKWQLCREFQLIPKRQNEEPRTPTLRRADVLTWLGVPAAEFESWVHFGIVSAIPSPGERAKAFYRRGEIKTKVLGQRGERWKATDSVIDYVWVSIGLF